MKLRYFFYLIFICLFTHSGCNPARHLPEDQYFVNKNEIEVKDADIQTRELRNYIRQVPNRRIFGFYRFHLNVYLFADRREESRFTNWLKNAIGEQPVIYNPVLTENTANQFKLYLQRKGYFESSVDYDVEFLEKRKHANITYYLEGGNPYQIRDITYSIPDPRVAEYVFNDTINSLIRRSEIYDVDILQKERDRISRNLRNDGFFHFSRDYIHFRVDSTLKSHKVDIDILVNNPVKVYRVDRRDSVVTKKHKRYKIDNIYIFPDYLALRSPTVKKDTTVYYHINNKNDKDSIAYYFVHHEPLRIKPSAIIKNLRFEPGDYYKVRHLEQSYSFLSALRIFRFTNFVFDESPREHFNSDTLGYLNSRIQLTPGPANSFSIDGEGFNTAGNLGVGGNFLFQNRNIFRGGETFNIRLKGALELAGDLATDDIIQHLPFNTLEFGGEVSFDFPDLLLPFTIERISAVARPKTTIMLGINFRQRPDYTRYIWSLTYGFEWSPSKQKLHNLFPAEISSIRVYNDSLLRARIPEGNPLILSSFSDHLITGMRYRYIYNTQQVGRHVDFVYSIVNIETAGNLLWLAGNIFDMPKDEGSYTLFNIPFAQFVKADIDYRYYRVFDRRNTIVFRIMGGAGIPYGNRDVLPFIKSYYGGGANSMRAWPIYTLGPGSYSRETKNDEQFYDRYGDIKLEANIEYRFDIYKSWKGALFVEGGNVWYARENPDFPGGKFNFDTFYKDIAAGAGIGTRFDFGFFVVRIDAAVPIRDPAKPQGERWISSWPSFSLRKGDINYNIGIGYPF